MKHRHIILLLVSILVVINYDVSNASYIIDNTTLNYSLEEIGGFDRIYCEKAASYSVPNQPEVPVFVKKYIVPTDANITGIKIINVGKEKLSGSYSLIVTQNTEEQVLTGINTPQSDDVYNSHNPYPGSPIAFSSSGFFRGHQVALVSVCPFEYISSEQALYFYTFIEFEFVVEGVKDNIPEVKRLDQSTIQTLNGMIENPDDISIGSTRSYQRIASSVSDSIPCLIITNNGMLGTFQNYAWYKTKKGTKTEVLPISAIDHEYYYGIPADTFPQSVNRSIKRCIKDYCENKFTEWVILGGDLDIIPPIYVESHGEMIITDQYYADLDGNWDKDGDYIYGEMIHSGDSVDYVSDVYVGRIPCSNTDEAQNVIDKIITYESDRTKTGYQTDILYLSSQLYYENDGLLLNQKLDNIVPNHFNRTFMNHQDSMTVINAMSSGKGIITFYGHAQGSHDFLVQNLGDYQLVYHHHFDQTNCNDQYPVFFNFTCRNARLDQENVVARDFMISDSGGGVGYMGSTFHEWSLSYQDYHQLMFNKIFVDGETRLGKVMAEAKIDMQPYYPWHDSYGRYAYFSYIYLGDPQMELWTDSLGGLWFDPYNWIDTVSVNEPFIAVKVVNDSAGPIEGAKVCLTKGESTYMISYTNSGGFAVFSGTPFDTEGLAYIVASKSNYFLIEDTIYVGSSGGGGCPMLYVHDGYDYKFVNSIMAKSEDAFYSSSNNLEGYPLYSFPLLDNNTLKLRIREDEKEKSFFDMLGASYVKYPNNARIAFTNKNEFRMLTGDSLLPIAATDMNEENILGQLAAYDGNYFVSKMPGYIVLTYKPEGFAKVLTGGEMGGGIEPPPGGGKGAPKYAVDGISAEFANKIVVSILDGNNQWQVYDEQYSRIRDVEIYSDLSGKYSTSEIKVKVEWTDEISLDCLPFYFFEDGQLGQIPLNPINVSHSEFGNVAFDIASSNGLETALMPGQYIDLELGPIPYQEGYKTALVFNSIGRYNKLSDEFIGTNGIVFGQNYPNPFNPTTSFSFYLPSEHQVKLVVYNVLGQKVTDLVDRVLPAGNHEITWNGTDDNGRLVSSGMYFAKFTAGEFVKTRKLTIIK